MLNTMDFLGQQSQKKSVVVFFSHGITHICLSINIFNKFTQFCVKKLLTFQDCVKFNSYNFSV